MKKRIIRGLSAVLLSLSCSSLIAFASLADTDTADRSVSGSIDTVTETQIGGWAWNSKDMDEIINVELHIYPSGSSDEVYTGAAKAEQYRDDLHETLKDGYHGFQYAIDWSSLEGTSFDIKAYAVSETERIPLEGISSYTKGQASGPAAPAQTDAEKEKEQYGPGYAMYASSEKTESKEDTKPAMTSLGIFTTSGYCNCEKCSKGNGLTYAGTVPQANHTISADITKLPLGTRVMIGDTIYTVEDIGSGVNGNKIDIYYASHEEAWNHGIQQAEVFLIEDMSKSLPE